MSESVSEIGAVHGARKSRAARANGGADLDRLPPHSVEAEAGVLGCILLSPTECMGICAEKIRGGEQWFYVLKHQTIFNVLREMYDKQEAVDILTVQQKLKDRNILEEVGGIMFLNQLQDAVPSAANLPSYLEFVREKFLLRRMVSICSNAVTRAYEHEGQVEPLLIGIESEMSKLTEAETPKSEEHIKSVVNRVISSVEDRHYKRGSAQLRGLPTGPAGNYLDKMIGGIRDTYYMLLAGRPGSGKTSLAMNLVEYLALDYVWRKPTGPKIANSEKVMVNETMEVKGIPVAVFSIEMDADCLVERLMFGRAGVDSAQFGQGYAKSGDMEKLPGAAADLAKSNIYIDASPNQTMGLIAAKARRMVQQYGIKLFVLDYVQLVEQEGGNGFDRVKELTKISRKIMALKKQLKVPWLVLCQMNRNIETAERERKPVLSDLKDCGALEQDCDLAIFTYKTPRAELEREPLGGGKSDKEILTKVCGGWPWSERPYRVDLVVPKYRFGPTGEAQMVFCKNLCRFEDWHLWKVKNHIEERKEGESKQFGETPGVPEMDVNSENNNHPQAEQKSFLDDNKKI